MEGFDVHRSVKMRMEAVSPEVPEAKSICPGPSFTSNPIGWIDLLDLTIYERVWNNVFVSFVLKFSYCSEAESLKYYFGRASFEPIVS